MGKRPRASIITAVNVWNDYRQEAIKRAIQSVDSQAFRDFEYIIVNDGSSKAFEVPSWVKLVNKEHEERVVAYEEGLKNAQGEIICFLDSDDEYEPHYLERVDSFFRQYPAYKLFNFGCRFVHADGGETLRGPFKPKKEKVGHEVFGGGTIVNGTFVFKREIYNDLGGFPPKVIQDIDCSEINYSQGPRELYMWTPYDFSAAAQMEFPEIRQYFMVDHINEPNKIIKELGNPWGQDFYIFYKYTRKYWSKPIDEYLLKVHWKAGIE